MFIIIFHYVCLCDEAPGTKRARRLLADISPFLFIHRRKGMWKVIYIPDNDKVKPLSSPCFLREITRGRVRGVFPPLVQKMLAAEESQRSVKPHS